MLVYQIPPGAFAVVVEVYWRVELIDSVAIDLSKYQIQ